MFLLIVTLFVTQPSPAPSKSIAAHLADCHRIAMARNYRIHGSVRAQLKIGDKGRVQRVFIKKETVKSPLLLRCMKYHLLRQIYPGKRSVEFRFNFPRSRGQYAVWSQDVPINRSLGNGSAARVVLDSGSVGAKKFSMTVVRIAKKGRLVSRFHPKSHSFFFVLDGSGQLEWAQNTKKTKYLPVSTGSAVYLPPGTVYRASGASDPPMVLLVIHTPMGPESYLSGGLTGKETILIPPTGLSMSAKFKPVPGAGMKAKYKQINFTSSGVFHGGAVIAIPRVGVLGVMHAPNGRRVRVTPARGGEAALFVAQGAGSLRNARGSWPVQPGSGLYFPVGGTYTPGIATVPLYAVWFSSSRAPRIEVLKK